MSGLFLLGTVLQGLVGLLLFSMALFLILLVLVQRGRGGGLTGALGGMGGQSAFGTRAGDTFTRITVIAAAIWIITCAISVKYLGSKPDLFSSAGGGTGSTGEVAPTISTGAEDGAGMSGDGADDTTATDADAGEGAPETNTPDTAAPDTAAPDTAAADETADEASDPDAK